MEINNLNKEKKLIKEFIDFILDQGEFMDKRIVRNSLGMIRNKFFEKRKLLVKETNAKEKKPKGRTQSKK